MRTFRVILGSILGIFVTIAIGTLFYGISQATFADGSDLYIVAIALFVFAYIVLQFLFLVKFGFYKEGDAERNNKLFMIGSPAIIFLLLIGYLAFEYRKDIIARKSEVPRKSWEELRRELAQKRENVFNDKRLSLYERLEPLQIGRLNTTEASEFASIKYSVIDGLNPEIGKSSSKYEFDDFFDEKFYIRSKIFLQKLPRKITLIKDSIVAGRSENGKELKETLSSSKQFLGYLAKQRLLVFNEEFEEDPGANYYCVSEQTGEIIEGVPLLGNDDLNLYANISFIYDHIQENKYLQLAIWYHDNSRPHFVKFLVENIQVTDSSLKLSSIFWIGTTLNIVVKSNDTQEIATMKLNINLFE